ncbi:protein maintenance of meristems [Tanacetum coccineum]
MKVAHSPGWKRVGIHDAIMNSILKIPLNKNLIFWFAEKWSPKTNTFILPWGEITITLEDMMVLGGLSVLGDPVTSHLESPQNCDALSQLNKAYKKLIASPSKKARFSAWMNEFMDNQNVHEHEAFLVLWLSKYLFPSVKDTVLPETFNLAIRLARGQKLALAPAVLATLYRDLHLLQNTILDLQQGKNESVLLQVFSPMYYMQVWVLERFPLVRPYAVGNVRDDETRLAIWANPVNKRTDYATLEWGTCGKQFVWRPYVKDTDHFIAHAIYKEDATIEKIDNDELESFARCVRVSKLVGLDISQQYFPHRVSRRLRYIRYSRPRFFQMADAGQEIELQTRAAKDAISNGASNSTNTANATLLGWELTYDKGGNSKWMATFVQSAGFPILIPVLLFVPPSIKATSAPPVSTVLLLYLFFGFNAKGDNLIYTLHLSRPVVLWLDFSLVENGTAIAWQICSVGILGLIFEVSSLFSNVIGTLALPIVPVLAVIFFGDKMDGVKAIALLLAIWGSVSYVYQHYLDDRKLKAKARSLVNGDSSDNV